MLKVMIVEDEDIVREDIKSLIDWEKHGYSLAAEARNGGEGLRVYRKYNPDVIISDIKMPVMSGLDMIERIAEEHGNTKVILLTAYGDFDYARKALRLGIQSYVLKHELDGSVLLQELNKVRQLYDEEKKLDFLTRTEAIRQLLQGSRAAPEFLFRWQGRTGVFVAGFTKPPEGTSDGLPAPEDRLGWLQVCYQQVLRDLDAELIDLDSKTYAIFYHLPPFNSERESYSFAYSLASRLQDRMAKLSQGPVKLAVGPSFEHCGELHERLRITEKLFATAVFRKESCILTGVRSMEVLPRLRQEIEDRVEEIKAQLNREEFEALKTQAEDLFLRLLVQAGDPELLTKCAVELNRALAYHGVSKHAMPDADLADPASGPSLADNVFDICRKFLAKVDRLAEHAHPKYSKKMQELLAYIRENCQKDIPLTEVADRLGVSLIYSSQLFKKEVGVSFMTYLTKCRIEKAQELMRSGNYKVYEISSMVGYQTVQYFSKIFKKVTGKNPSDYM